MKQDTKKLLIGGGAVAAIAYFIFRPSGDAAGLGGGGGIPLLTEPLQEASAAAEEAIGSVVYNFPVIPGPQWDVETLADPAAVISKKAEILTPTALPIDTKTFGGFTLPELRAAPIEFFESDIFAQQTGLMTRTRTSEVIQDMLKESKKRGYITHAVTQKHHAAASKRFDISKYKTSGSKKGWTGGLRSTTKGAGVHFTTSGTGTLKKRPSKKKLTPGSPD